MSQIVISVANTFRKESCLATGKEIDGGIAPFVTLAIEKAVGPQDRSPGARKMVDAKQVAAYYLARRTRISSREIYDFVRSEF